jgi:hypothetical protein
MAHSQVRVRVQLRSELLSVRVIATPNKSRTTLFRARTLNDLALPQSWPIQVLVEIPLLVNGLFHQQMN